MKLIISENYKTKLLPIPGSRFFHYRCDHCGDIMRAKESDIEKAKKDRIPIYCLKCKPTGVPGKSLTKDLNTLEEDPDAFKKNLESNSHEYSLIKLAGFDTGHWQTKSFRDSLSILPVQVQQLASQKYQTLLSNPQQVGIKPLPENRGRLEVWSAQVGNRYRALAVKFQSQFVWYWIGSHEEYNKLKSMPPNSQVMNIVQKIMREGRFS